MIAKTKYHTIAEWNFSLWFALLSPLIGGLFIEDPKRGRDWAADAAAG
jgi:hypothetical protein